MTGTTQLTPGVDQIQIKPVDSDSGSGHETTEIKLALSEADLDTAVAGAALDLGTTLTSGASGVVVIYIGVTNAVTTVGNSTELGIMWRGLIRQVA